MIGAFARATSSILSRLGEDAVLRGTVNCKAHLDYDVTMTDREGNMFVANTLVTISKTHSPVPDDTLTVGTQDYILEIVPSPGETIDYILEIKLE